MYHTNGRVSTASKPMCHQKSMLASKAVIPRPRITVWLTKNSAPVSRPRLLIQTPHVRCSAFSRIVQPSQNSRTVLVRDTAMAAQLAIRLIMALPALPLDPVAALVLNPRRAILAPGDQTALTDDDR